jgi:protein-arginine kinase
MAQKHPISPFNKQARNRLANRVSVFWGVLRKARRINIRQIRKDTSVVKIQITMSILQEIILNPQAIS